MYIISLHTVPTPTVNISPSGPIQGAMVGSPQVINCIVAGVIEVESSSVMIAWMGPNGVDVMNNSGTIFLDLTASNGNTTYTSSLQFAYLIEGDNGTYTCNFMASEISVSQSVELPLTSKLSFTSHLCVQRVYIYSYVGIKIILPELITALKKPAFFVFLRTYIITYV